jgi:hypothetical protein
VVVGLALALSACASPRVVPVPDGSVTVDPARETARVAAGGVELLVRPSAWRGAPWDLASYVTPFHVELRNSATVPLAYDYTGFLLFDESRYQYSALPPDQVARILRSAETEPVVLAALAEAPSQPVVRRRVVVAPWLGWWGPWGPWGPWGWPYYPLPVTDVYLSALPEGPLASGAHVGGFVYFPRLRRESHRLTLELHHRLGEAPAILTVPFGVERSERDEPAPRG